LAGRPRAGQAIFSESVIYDAMLDEFFNRLLLKA
jgi:hypothetical protein